VLSSASGFAQVGVVDVATGQLTPVTSEARQHDAPSWSPDGTTLAFVRSDGIGLSNQVATAPADGSAAPRDLTSGRAVRKAPRFAPDGASVAYLETASNRSSDIWSVALDGGTPSQLTHSMGKLDPDRLSVAEEATFLTIDNLPIPTLIMKPADFEPGRRYPVLVALHGHPGEWNHAMQLMWQWVISRGVVIVAPNQRGTIGLGSGFHDLHVGDDCGAEFEDILAAVDFVRTLSYIDTRRIASWGGSGGGNMSLLVATMSPETFVAQIIRAPVSSWKWLALDRYTAQSRFGTAFRDPKHTNEEMGGSYAELGERYDERSPLNFVEHARIPQLLMHGRRDSSVPINESRRWVERMRELGKGHLVDYIEYPDEDHSLLRYRATVRDMGQRIVRFLATHLDAPYLLDGLPSAAEKDS
jgi:dipeptidyl aminopeptidase/acylaminoacyl peptidase